MPTLWKQVYINIVIWLLQMAWFDRGYHLVGTSITSNVMCRLGQIFIDILGGLLFSSRWISWLRKSCDMDTWKNNSSRIVLMEVFKGAFLKLLYKLVMLRNSLFGLKRTHKNVNHVWNGNYIMLQLQYMIVQL
jgi:hypothetical protein